MALVRPAVPRVGPGPRLPFPRFCVPRGSRWHPSDALRMRPGPCRDRYGRAESTCLFDHLAFASIDGLRLMLPPPLSWIWNTCRTSDPLFPVSWAVVQWYPNSSCRLPLTALSPTNVRSWPHLPVPVVWWSICVRLVWRCTQANTFSAETWSSGSVSATEGARVRGRES